MATLTSSSKIRRIFPAARQLLLEADINRHLPRESKRILVIGAGFDPYKAKFPHAELYIAADIVFHHGATNIIADAMCLPFADGAFDCVIATEVAEHVRNPRQLIDEAYRVLGIDGKLILTVPFAFQEHADPADYWRPTRWTLKEATEKFKLTNIWPQGNRLHVISDLITTAFAPRHPLVPLRIFNHLFIRRHCGHRRSTTCPSGYFVSATK